MISAELTEYIKERLGNKMFIDWYSISFDRNLTVEFLKEFKQYIRWQVFSSRLATSHAEIDVNILREFKDELYWKEISASKKLSIEIVEEFQDYLYFDIISGQRDYANPSFLTKFKNKLNFYTIYELHLIEEFFIQKNLFEQVSNDRNILLSVLSYQKLSEEFIENIIKMIDLSDREWMTLSRVQKLSEHFIKKYIDKLSMDFICTYQILSEQFIRDHKNLVKWRAISYSQCLSEDFIWEFSELLDFDELRYNNNLDPELKNYLSRNNFNSGGTNLNELLKENNLT